MYQFREVRCPYCPACSSFLYVAEHILDGLKEDDPRIIEKGFE